MIRYLYFEMLKKKYAFNLLVNEKNLGVSAARNKGIKEAKGKFLNFLDGDDFLLPGKLKYQLQLFKENPRAAVVYSDSYLLQDDVISAYTLSSLWRPATGDILSRLLQGNCIALHSALINREKTDNQYFDESLRRAEDWDYWLRLAQTGATYVYNPKPLVVYRREENSLSSDTLASLDSAWKVLEKVDTSMLSGSQLKSINNYKTGIFLHRADIFTRTKDAKAMTYFAEAQSMGSIGLYRSMTLFLMQLNFFTGMSFYILVSSLAQKINLISRSWKKG